MIIAIRPAAGKNPNDVIRYRCPITLWSVVASQAASSERLRGLRGAATGAGPYLLVIGDHRAPP